MATSAENFDYEDGPQGVRFIALSHHLAIPCLSEDEIDRQRDRLLHELADVAARMKAALGKRPMMFPLPGA